VRIGSGLKGLGPFLFILELFYFPACILVFIGYTYLHKVNDIQFREANMEDTKTIISVFGTESEKAAMRKIKNASAGDRQLSWSDFILEHFGVRKAEVTK
jgi:Na+/H+-dicarboxylate symporter